MWKRLEKLWRKKRSKGFTFMVVPNSQGNVKSINIPFFAMLIIMSIIIINLCYLCDYQSRVVKIKKLNNEITEKEERITQLSKDLERIEPSLKRTEELTEQINRQKKLAAEIRSFYQSVRHKVGRRTGVSRSVRPVSLVPPSRENPLDNKGKYSLQLLDTNLKFLEEQTPIAEEDLNKLLRELKDFSAEYDHTPTIWPTNGRITSGYGRRIHPITRKLKVHSGVDIRVRKGTSVKAAADGVVEFSGYRGGYGWTVILRHGYGYKTLYAHNSDLLAKVGQRVKKGSVISLSGNSGTSTGPHLHYEVWVNNKRTNPISFLGR
jgi:murein DD-endopeptidase MepM/ murein hydrolase activator NlpD